MGLFGEIGPIPSGGDTSTLVPTTRQINTTAPLTGGGDLSADRTIGITQATAGTDGYLTAADWTTFNAKMSNVMTALGDIIYGGAAGAPTRLPTAAGANEVLHNDGATPYWDVIDESHFTFSNVTTANTTSAQHGLCPRLSNNANQWLDGTGNWSTPAAGIQAAYTSVTFTGQTSVNVIHNFGAYPVVDVIDNAGAALIPQSVVHNSINDFTVTFLASTTGTIIATLGSPQRQNIVTTTVDYTASVGNRIIQVSVAGKYVALPTAVGIDGAEFIVDNSSDGNIYVYPNGVETIEDEVEQTLPYNSAMHIYSDGAGWRIY